MGYDSHRLRNLAGQMAAEDLPRCCLLRRLQSGPKNEGGTIVGINSSKPAMRRKSLTGGSSATAGDDDDAAGRLVSIGADQPGDSKFELALDRDWRITSITKSAAAWAGSTVDDLIGRQCQDLNPAATRLLNGPIEAALAQGVTSTQEHPSTHVPGRWVRVEVAPSEGGVRVRFEDITSPDSADETIGPGESPEEIVLLNQQGVIVSANAAWRASIVALGQDLSNVGVGSRYIDTAKTLVPELDEVAFGAQLDALFSGEVSRLEATYSRDGPDGKRPRQAHIAPLRIGETTYFLAIHEDLTERAKVLAELNSTSDQLLHAQEEERQRIAIELHDSMSQHLVGLLMGLAALSKRLDADPAGRAIADEMAKLTMQAAQETRVLSYLMNASGKERENFDVSVQRFVEGFGRRAGLSVTFEAEGRLNRIGAATRHAIFRVVQEAMSNVYRHAHATKVAVKLVSREGVLTASIADDGCDVRRGAEVGENAPPLGVGIPGMRVRVEQLGGHLEVTFAAEGTTVVASVPLSA
jgi:two-component system NarL family sensor kinase